MPALASVSATFWGAAGGDSTALDSFIDMRFKRLGRDVSTDPAL